MIIIISADGEERGVDRLDGDSSPGVRRRRRRRGVELKV